MTEEVDRVYRAYARHSLRRHKAAIFDCLTVLGAKRCVVVAKTAYLACNSAVSCGNRSYDVTREGYACLLNSALQSLFISCGRDFIWKFATDQFQPEFRFDGDYNRCYIELNDDRRVVGHRAREHCDYIRSHEEVAAHVGRQPLLSARRWVGSRIPSTDEVDGLSNPGRMGRRLRSGLQDGPDVGRRKEVTRDVSCDETIRSPNTDL